MKLPNIDDGSCSSGIGMPRGPRIVPASGLVSPNIRGDACPVASVADIQNFLGRASVGRGWCLSNGVLVRQSCPAVTTFPTITVPNVLDYTAGWDEHDQLLYAGNQHGYTSNTIDVISTATQTLVAQYISNTAYAPFGAFATHWDNLHKLVILQSQSHGWGTFDPADTIFRHTLSDFGTLNADAGQHLESCCDKSTGICLFVAINDSGTGFGGYEIIQHSDHSTGAVLYNSGYTLAFLKEVACFNEVSDQFIVGITAGGFYYVNKLTGAKTASALSAAYGSFFSFNGLSTVVTTDASSHFVFIDTLTDTVLATTADTAGATVYGAAYNSCRGELYISTGLQTHTYDSTTYALKGTSSSHFGLYFDKWSNLTFALNGASAVTTF